MTLKEINAVAGVLYANNKILLARRRTDASFPQHWEFPGGKMEEGESAKEALIRELYEEIGIKANLDDLHPLKIFKVETDDAVINLTAFKVLRWDNEASSKEAQPLYWHNLDDDFPYTPLLATTIELLGELKVDI